MRSQRYSSFACRSMRSDENWVCAFSAQREPDWLALAAAQIVQCDLHHLRRRPPVPVNFASHLKHLPPLIAAATSAPPAHRDASFTPKLRPKPTRHGAEMAPVGSQ